jgi:hypothetical protein
MRSTPRPSSPSRARSRRRRGPARRRWIRLQVVPARNVRCSSHRRVARCAGTGSTTSASSHQRIVPPRRTRRRVNIVSSPPLSPKRSSNRRPRALVATMSSSRLLVAAPCTVAPVGRRERRSTALARAQGASTVRSHLTGAATAVQRHSTQRRTSSAGQPGPGSSSSSMKTRTSSPAAASSARLRAAAMPGAGSCRYDTACDHGRTASSAPPEGSLSTTRIRAVRPRHCSTSTGSSRARWSGRR